MNIPLIISKLLSIQIKQVETTINLLNDGGTVPFISRYRKEATGNLDEVQVDLIKNELERLLQLQQRKEVVLKSIDLQGKLTDELKEQINEIENITKLEDIYLPYKPKKRTKATIAKEKGLEPLALLIYEQKNIDIFNEAEKYIDLEKNVQNVEEALQGARDIIAEKVNENIIVREKLRNKFKKEAIINSHIIEGKENEGIKYKDYFNWQEPLIKCPSHRMLAMRRGEKEGYLILDINIDKEEGIKLINDILIKNNSKSAIQIIDAIEDCYKRLLQPSIEVETRIFAKQQADEKAIQVFAENLRELLLSAPLGQKAILAIDPGFRTGCKIVALNKEGKLLEDTVIYPHEENKKKLSEQSILTLCEKHKIEAIAIGNGTASRETENFIRKIENLPKEIIILMVSESGASIYSASEVAREEFPNYDLTVRGAVSIGRRLADPLAELVKLDPKSIGVGQYQHDVDQSELKNKLDSEVISCVNKVGVELNTASQQLLSYVSGIGDVLAKNIIEYRNLNGAFKSRKELLKVNRMGEKIFEQCSGFLRIRDAKNPLDKSAVHPESYYIVEQMSKDLDCSIDDLIKNKNLRQKINIHKYINDKIGIPTLKDILNELEKPGRDPRKNFETFKFDDNVHEIKDLKIGMTLPGIVTNVTNFGAFVDIGVHQDGLIHISQLSNTYITDPNIIVKVGQKVNVNITEVDINRKRIALSMIKQNNEIIPNKINNKRENKQPNKDSMENALNDLMNKFKKK